MTLSQVLLSVTSINLRPQEGRPREALTGVTMLSSRSGSTLSLSSSGLFLLLSLLELEYLRTKLFSPVHLFIIPASLGVLYVSWDIKW